ncbi:MAG: hypothetical protein Q4C00_04900 [Bacillota bacterium]|nr:hypothetical protein [Bacillota bacterium]
MSLRDLLPSYYRDILEMAMLLAAEDREFEGVDGAIEDFPAENSVANCSEEGVALWEAFLGVEPWGNLMQRKMFIIAMLRGQGQLNEEKIKAIVNSFTGTGDSAMVELSDSVLRVRVLPPEWGEIYDFSEIEGALSLRVPAHIGLTVERFYCTWQDIADNNPDWAGIMNAYANWVEVKNKI